jgi:hypothetical protein
MDNKQPSTPPQRRRFFAVKLTPDQLRLQLDHYYTLPVYRSARGIAALWLIGASLFITFFGLIVAFASPSPARVLGRMFFFFLAPSLLTAFFIYRGHRWAMIFAIILTLAFFFLHLFSSGINHFNFIFFFILFYVGQFFYQAFQVENARNVTTNQQTSRVSS